MLGKGRGDAVEICDVRRGWIAKWAVGGSAGEGGVAGECSLPHLLSPFTHLIWFGDSHPHPQGLKLKHLGDPPTTPVVALQNMGTYVREGTTSDIRALVHDMHHNCPLHQVG